MKKIFLLFALLLPAAVAAGQTATDVPDKTISLAEVNPVAERPKCAFLDWKRPHMECRNEIHIASFSMMDGEFVYGWNEEPYNSYGSLYAQYSNSKTVFGDRRYVEGFSLSYLNHTGKRWSYGAGFAYTGDRMNVYERTTGRKTDELYTDTYIVSPTIRWSFVSVRGLRIYLTTGLNIGATMQNDGLNGMFEPFLGFGYTIGNRIFLVFDSKSSSTYSSISIGVGYRF